MRIGPALLLFCGLLQSLPVPEAAAQARGRIEPDVRRNERFPGGEPNPPAPATNRVARPQPAPSPKDRIAFTDARRRLGDAMPDGARVRLGLVEGGAGAYAPDPASGMLRGLNLVTASGDSDPSGHATMTATLLAGRSGLVGEPVELRVWSVADWMGSGFLNAGTPDPPAWTPRSPQVFSHSWIGTDTGQAAQVLRRVDHVIDRHDVVMAVGVNNGRDTPVPTMLSSAHNVIAVGVASGNSSGGLTQIEGRGRVKPDIVAPTGTTSEATPLVAGAAALLIERAEVLDAENPPSPGGLSYADARRAETIKAALLASARKSPRWSNSPEQPLDAHLGAGVLDVDQALRVIEAGQTAPGGKMRRGRGHSFGALGPGEAHEFVLEPGGALKDLTFALTWHRRVLGVVVSLEPKAAAADATVPLDELERPVPRTGWVPVPVTTDFDLSFVRVADDGTTDLVDFSRSRVDNVELLRLRRLPAGTYRLVVSRGESPEGAAAPDLWDYAMAWTIGGPAG